MNTELLLKAADMISAEPKRLNMGRWIGCGVVGKREQAPPCGTTACIAGWVAMLNTGKASVPEMTREIYASSEIVEDIATRALGLTHEMAQRLFYTTGWPHQFGHPYDWGDLDQQAKAKIAVARIRHFIATDGKE